MASNMTVVEAREAKGLGRELRQLEQYWGSCTTEERWSLLHRVSRANDSSDPSVRARFVALRGRCFDKL